ncbi:hypothetical protein L208DRAFT_1423588 [Tricholoma matsutake]|nr:hypothetical protein L208DRAFT_1423588 [Tricholoma matsutake 945]
MSSQNHNPQGKNQHGHVSLQKYHQLLTHNKTISELLLADYGITMSERTVKRRCHQLGLSRSGVTTRTMPYKKRADKFVLEVMHKHDSKGFKRCNPTARKIHRTPKVLIGIHERWAGDGDDKLYGIGFPIWAVVDNVTGRWLDGWVVPSNCMRAIIGYLFLCLVEKYGDYMHNISIERQWLKLCLNWGDTAILDYQKGIDEGLYNPQNAQEFELCQWLWLKYLRQSIAEEMTITNGARMQKDKNKAGPSGMSCDTVFSLPASWGGKDCLLPIEDMGFVLAEFSDCAEVAYNTLHIENLMGTNIWHVFQELLPLVCIEVA